MIVRYSAFSWTMTAADLKEMLIGNIRQMVDRVLSYAKGKLENDDPDRDELLYILKQISDALDAGEDAPPEWMDVVAWSWQFQELDPCFGGGGAIGKCTYYSAVDGVTIPPIALGKTSTVIDRPGLHLAIDTEVIV